MLVAVGSPGTEPIVVAALAAAAAAVLGAALWCRRRAARWAAAEQRARAALEVACAALGSEVGATLATRLCGLAAQLLGCRLVELLARRGSEQQLTLLGSAARAGAQPGGSREDALQRVWDQGRVRDERSLGLPVRDASGQTVGALWCEDDGPLAVTPEQECVLGALARLAATALVEAPQHECPEAVTVGGATRCEVRSLTRAAAAAADAIFVTDERGVIRWVNGAFESITGWPRDQAVGRKASLLKSGAHELEFYKKLWQDIIAGRTWSGRVINRRRNGSVYHAAQTIAALTEADGSVCGFVAVQRDVTADVEREMQLVHLQEELAHSARQLEDKNRHLEFLRKAADEASAVKGRFLARTSHEMRTPLHGLLGFVDILLEGETDGQRRSHLLAARTSGRQLLAMVEDFLDVSQIEESERQPLETTEFELEPLLEGLVSLHEQRARDRGLTLRHLLRPQPVPRLRGDATRLRRVLKYALERQIKDAPEGLVEFEIDVRLVTAERAELSIRITSAAPADDKAVEVTLARRLCTGLGGRLDLDAVPGRGSVCRLRVPMGRVGAATDAAAALHPAHAEPLPSGRVLLVDDNPVNQRVAHLVLSRAHYEVHVADDGRQAVDRARQTTYDLILMDCQMPVMDGFAATKAIRGQEKPGHRVPIVAMTARALDGERQRCLEAGMDDFLAKPVQPEELRRLAARYVRGAQPAPAADASAPAPAAAGGELPEVTERLQELGMLAEPELAIESLELFLTDADLVLQELHHAVQNKDHVATEGLAHRLKGASGNLGASELTRIARDIEEAGRQQRTPELGEITAELTRVRNALLRTIASLRHDRQMAAGAP